MIIEPGWLEIIQLLIRLALILLCCGMVGSAFKNEPTDTPVFFLMMIGVGSGLITILAGLRYSGLPGIVEILLFVSLLIGVSIIATGSILKADHQKTGYKNASGIWVSGILGITIGSGYYLAAIIVSVVSYFMLYKINTGHTVS